MVTQQSTPGAIQLAVSAVIFALRPTREDAGAVSLAIPLVRRTRAPFAGRWALPGGEVEPDRSLADTAAAKLFETTALSPTYLEQLHTFGEPDRSSTGRVISVVYWALVRPDLADSAVQDDNVRWFPADDLPELAFDHNLIVQYALWRLRTKMEYSRIAHALLGETFTLAELRRVHEIVMQRQLDPANFRRQIEGSGVLVDTGQTLAGARHRPPRLYRYDTTVELADHGPLGPATLGGHP